VTQREGSPTDSLDALSHILKHHCPSEASTGPVARVGHYFMSLHGDFSQERAKSVPEADI
jgi:hypothetical protein